MMRFRVGLIGLALLAALFPVSEDVVESVYSRGAYPLVQGLLTSWSNLVPIALFDVLVVGVLAGWLIALWRDTRRRRWPALLFRVMLRTATIAAALYLTFLVSWGFNYRRVPLESKLELDYRAVTPAAAERLLRTAVAELNRLHPARTRDASAVNASLPQAFAAVQTRLGAARPAVPGRPKRTLIDPYFRAASVDGMTNPWFLETMTLSTLLPVEQTMIVAHEWAHLAGFADEGEANFVGWLTCLSGDAAARYSGWLFLYMEAAGAVEPAARRDIAMTLDAGPRADLTAISERVRAQVNPRVSAIGWGIYDRYLKANGVERGTRSYTDVVRLVLGTSLGTAALGTTAPGTAALGSAMPGSVAVAPFTGAVPTPAAVEPGERRTL